MDLSTLPDDLRSFISRQLETGRFESLEELCAEALRRYALEESYFDDSAGDFRASIARGIADLEAGRVKDGPQALDELRTRMLERRER